jgi:nickel/cobalt transporter (NiCoT) family protein
MVPTRSQVVWYYRSHRLTLFGRSALLIGCELLANAICWAVAGILFGKRRDSQSILGLSLLAWVGTAPLSMREHMP